MITLDDLRLKVEDNPCNNCSDKVEDDYGLLCDLSCRRNSAWRNYESGYNDCLQKLIDRGDVYILYRQEVRGSYTPHITSDFVSIAELGAQNDNTE